MDINLVLLILMMISTLWTVMCRSLIKATIGLAVTSAILTAIMFRLNSALAAVFELSVCTGLITVVFVSTISLTKPLTHKEIEELSKARHKRFGYLPIVIALAAAAIYFLKIPNDFSDSSSMAIRSQGIPEDVCIVLWNFRKLDLFAQIMLIIAGSLGVATLFEERKIDEW
jgi:NADH-quinone oxidoreductase subunit J